MIVGKGLLAGLGVSVSVTLAALCCGLTLLAVAVVAAGATVWLAAHGSLLTIPAVVLAAALLVLFWRRTKRISCSREPWLSDPRP